jgi:hypothetical protein
LLSFLAIIIATPPKKTGTIYTAEEALREASTVYKNINDLKWPIYLFEKIISSKVC